MGVFANRREYEVSKEVEFDAGHRVPNHLSKCASPHGHRYRCRVTWAGPLVTDEEAADAGMVVDFGELKRLLTEYVHDRFDHSFIVYSADTRMLEALTGLDFARVVTVPFTPTAENLAAHICATLQVVLPEHVRLVSVELWETPTSLATVRP